jgi:nucleoside-diphosphate-sugar epimerase
LLNCPIAEARKIKEKLSLCFIAREFGMKIAIIRPSNMYGPRDNIEQEKAHVIPNLLTKIMSGEDKITVFGTGKPTRAFLYVEDFCDGAMATAILRLGLIELRIESSKSKKLNLFELFEKIISNENPQVSQIEIDLSELFFEN